MQSEYYDYDDLFYHGSRALRKVFQKGPSGRHEVVFIPGIMVGYQDVGIYNLSVDERRHV